MVHTTKSKTPTSQKRGSFLTKSCGWALDLSLLHWLYQWKLSLFWRCPLGIRGQFELPCFPVVSCKFSREVEPEQAHQQSWTQLLVCPVTSSSSCLEGIRQNYSQHSWLWMLKGSGWGRTSWWDREEEMLRELYLYVVIPSSISDFFNFFPKLYNSRFNL